MLVRLDLHTVLDIPAAADGTTRLGTYRLDTANHYGSRLRWASLEYDAVTVSLVPDPGGAARAILYTAPPRTGARIWLEPWVMSPVAEQPLRVGRRMLHAFVARRTGIDADFEVYEEAAHARIAEWEASFGWHYVGVFRAYGLEPGMRADLYVIEARDPAQALRKADVDEPVDIRRLHSEGTRFLDRGERRYQLWMSPLRVTAATRTGIRFAEGGAAASA